MLNTFVVLLMGFRCYLSIINGEKAWFGFFFIMCVANVYLAVKRAK